MANDGNGIGSSSNGADPMERIVERAIIRGSYPLIAEAWVKEMEKIFRALLCTEEQKVSFATFTFKEDAQEWWLLTLEKEEAVTWAKFLEVFYEKYFPESLREQKASEFLHLRQGTMSVTEYESKFTQLTRFAPYVIPTEAQKVRKFEAGLEAEIKDRLEVLKLPTYAEVVDRAYIAEKGIKTARSSGMGQKGGFGKQLEHQGQPHQRK
ncbi:uncharacterized protein LOC114323362 [Camellia sinensis]|uniref:uncharacterized protein LOC114323362 n=1 Tax=Camellia sinensis TaxID=4442 RepID=UPI0010355B96|nr:uncharacterized protein LOC114323362 [Camellia sinensis]